MSIVSASLDDVLSARERRLAVQKELLCRYQRPLVSFTLNIAGPYKNTPLIALVFDAWIKEILRRLGSPLACWESRTAAGPEAVFVYDDPAEALKTIAVQMENEGTIGRLLDIDVIDVNGEKLSRPHQRRCLVCGGPVTPCARSRRHPLKEIVARTDAILADFASELIADAAQDALLAELRLTPKPGLVDSANNGAHQDMDFDLMARSAACLRPYFLACAKFGLSSSDDVSFLQELGVRAEEDMLRCTGGVNTHKGAVYILGLLCAAAHDRDALFRRAGHFSRQLDPPARQTHGGEMKLRYGAGGVRAEARNDFPEVRHALQLLRGGTGAHAVFLSLLSRVEDTNLLFRGGPQGLAFVQKTAAEILALPEEQRLSALIAFDEQCIARTLSPGGSADLLAAALFVHALDPYELQ